MAVSFINSEPSADEPDAVVDVTFDGCGCGGQWWLSEVKAVLGNVTELDQHVLPRDCCPTHGRSLSQAA